MQCSELILQRFIIPEVVIQPLYKQYQFFCYQKRARIYLRPLHIRDCYRVGRRVFILFENLPIWEQLFMMRCATAPYVPEEEGLLSFS